MSVGSRGKECRHHSLDDNIECECEVDGLRRGAVLRPKKREEGQLDVSTQRRGGTSYAQNSGKNSTVPSSRTLNRAWKHSFWLAAGAGDDSALTVDAGRGSGPAARGVPSMLARGSSLSLSC